MQRRLGLFSIGNFMVAALVLSFFVLPSESATFARSSQSKHDDTSSSRQAISSTMPMLGMKVSLISGRIISGNNASLGEFPWQVYLRFSNSSDYRSYTYCGGSLITSSHVLTAAHCLIDKGTNKPFRYMHATIGVTDLKYAGQQRHVRFYTIHPAYVGQSNGFLNDIAVLQLAGPVIFNAHVKPVTLAKSIETSLYVAGRKVTTMGWGNTHPTIKSPPRLLRKASMTISTCGMFGNTILRVCATAERTTDLTRPGICQGDSGGPLVYGGTQAGVVTGTNKYRCGHPSVPDVFARVSYYYNWIKLQARAIR